MQVSLSNMLVGFALLAMIFATWNVQSSSWATDLGFAAIMWGICVALAYSTRPKTYEQARAVGFAAGGLGYYMIWYASILSAANQPDLAKRIAEYVCWQRTGSLGDLQRFELQLDVILMAVFALSNSVIAQSMFARNANASHTPSISPNETKQAN